MDLEIFLEKDMLDFLEKKDIERKETIAKVEEDRAEVKLSKDYLKLFRNHLLNGELKPARALFEEVQKKFAESKNEAEKEEYTGLIETMFAEMKKASNHLEGKQLEKLDMKQMQVKEEFTVAENEKSREHEIKVQNNAKQAINQILIDISDLLEHNKLKDAKEKYRIMKDEFTKLPESEEKEELVNDLISAFYQIKRFEQNEIRLKHQESEESADAKAKILSNAKEDIQISTKKIHVYLQNNEIVKAMQEYDNLKETFEHFPSKYHEEKKSLFKHILNVYKEIKTRAERIKPSEKLDQDAIFIVNLKSRMKEIIQLIKRHELHEAEVQLLDIKQSIHYFPDSRINERQSFVELIKELEHEINVLRMYA